MKDGKPPPPPCPPPGGIEAYVRDGVSRRLGGRNLEHLRRATLGVFWILVKRNERGVRGRKLRMTAEEFDIARKSRRGGELVYTNVFGRG